MFVHAVYFWLHDHLRRAERDAFVAGVHALTTISSVRHGYVGVPAPTDRPIIDRSYGHALVVVFESLADHDRYQADPIHDRFRETCGGFWKKVVIYDSVSES